MAKHNSKPVFSAMEKKPVKRYTPSIKVGFPRDGEIIDNATYTLQILTREEASSVDVCFNQGEWLPCRESLGLWWFDWSGYESGEHEVMARMRKTDGTLLISDPRIFWVKLPA